MGAKIHDHTTPSAKGEEIQGMTISVRKSVVPRTPLVSMLARNRPTRIWAGTTKATRARVTRKERRNAASVRTWRTCSSPT